MSKVIDSPYASVLMSKEANKLEKYKPRESRKVCKVSTGFLQTRAHVLRRSKLLLTALISATLILILKCSRSL